MSHSDYAETAALAAVLAGDIDEAARIVAGMYPGERAELARHLDTLRALLADRFGNDISHAPS